MSKYKTVEFPLGFMYVKLGYDMNHTILALYDGENVTIERGYLRNDELTQSLMEERGYLEGSFPLENRFANFLYNEGMHEMCDGDSYEFMEVSLSEAVKVLKELMVLHGI